MKTAFCIHTKAGIEISLNLYFDPKAFNCIVPSLTTTQEDELIRLVSDSISEALPIENAEKHFYIKRVFKTVQSLKLLCTDGFLVDSTLDLALSKQAYPAERVKISEMDQLPSHIKLSNEVVRSLNQKTSLFEEETRKLTPHKTVLAHKDIPVKNHHEVVVHEFTVDKAFDVLTEITRMKREIRGISESVIHTLEEEITREKKSATHSDYSNTLIQKLEEIKPIEEKFSVETESIIQNITKKTTRMDLFKQYVINALYEAAKKYHELILPKMENLAAHAKKNLAADFNRKFASIAHMQESGELSSLAETQKHLGSLPLENLEKIISSDSKENKGLLQRCNTSYTEESPELQITLKELGQLNKTLATLFNDEPDYANKEMVQIIRIPVPRSFQFKFSANAINYKKSIDDFCKTQKDAVMNLANQYKKIMQIGNLRLVKPAPVKHVVENKPAPESTESMELKKYKDSSDEIVALANKQHEATGTFIDSAKKLHDFLSANPNINLKALADKIRIEAENANQLYKQLIDIKSRIDIKINHYLLSPDEQPDLNELDQLIAAMKNKNHLQQSKNQLLQDFNHRLNFYDTVIKKVRGFDLSAATANVNKKRGEAKELLLQFIKKQNAQPGASEIYGKPMLKQYMRVDTRVADVEKILSELADMQKALFSDLTNQSDISKEKLETQFQAIDEKMKTLSSSMSMLTENVDELKKMGTSG